VQTLCPDAPAIKAAVRHDLPGFASQELPHREAFGYPPCASMIRIVVRSASAQTTQAAADELARKLRDQTTGASPAVRILGPAPAPISRLRGDYRFQIQLQSSDGQLLRSLVRAATTGVKPPDGVSWIVDVDPLDMM
jgi:primosomal protein N' (replication factor Y)